MQDQDSDLKVGAIAGVIIAVVVAIATTLFAAISSLSGAKTEAAPAAPVVESKAVAPVEATPPPAPEPVKAPEKVVEAPKPKPTYTKTINFASKSAALPTEITEELVAFAKELKADDRSYRVIGFSDSSGIEASNKKLSAERAKTLVKFLVAQGVPAARLTAEGMGSAHPVADNSTPEGRAKNRRIEFIEAGK